VDNDYILPYLNGRGSNPNHQAALYYLGVPLSRREHAGEEYWHAEHVPFQRIRQVARTGFIRATDFVPPEFRSRGGKREELNEYYMGNYLELIARNIREQGREAGREYRVRASLVVDGQNFFAYFPSWLRPQSRSFTPDLVKRIASSKSSCLLCGSTRQTQTISSP
jgi:hypothetical protein